MLYFKRTIIAGMILFLFAPLTALDNEEDILLLKIGNSSLKEKQISVYPNTLYSMQKGRPLTFADMIDEMKTSKFVYIGESHNDLAMHDFQTRVIQAFVKSGRDVAIGLEMMTVSYQETLNKWWLGLLSREEFIRESRWYENWNMNFGFYEKIFNFAKDNRIPMYGLNAPRKIISKIRMQGWEALSDEEKKFIPQPDLTHQDHRFLIRTIFENTDLPPQMKGAGLDMMFEGLYRSQSAWDEVMAENAVKAYGSEKRLIVVLAGSGHFLYNLGINRRAFERSQLPFKSVLSVIIPSGEECVHVSRSVSDYIWGIQEEEYPAYPAVGLSFKKFKELENLVIDKTPKDGVAEDKGFEKGDIILTVDDKPFNCINEIRYYLSRFGWGDQASFRVLRDGVIKEIVLLFEIPEADETQPAE